MNDLTVVTPDSASVAQYFFATEVGKNKMEMMAEDLGGEALDQDTLPSVNIPSGSALSQRGTVKWQLPGGSSDDIRGIILHRTAQRRFWEGAYTGEGAPPDCWTPTVRSDDVGIASPEIREKYKADGVGGACANCRMQEFGTARNQDGTLGAGKACNRRTDLYILRPDNRVLPLVVHLTEPNYRSFRAYAFQMQDESEVGLLGIETSLKLERTKTRNNLDYAAVVPEMVRKLSPEEVAHSIAAAKFWRPLIESQIQEIVDRGRRATLDNDDE